MSARRLLTIVLFTGVLSQVSNLAKATDYIAEAGHPSLQEWLLPAEPPVPKDNQLTPDRISLGKKLFFDPRISRDGNMSCATCHNPVMGWSDGLPVSKGFKSQLLKRATPTVINMAYNDIYMWDGRKQSLEEQAIGPMEAEMEMNTDLPALMQWLNQHAGYNALFGLAYPGDGINRSTVSKALASFQRTLISDDSPFDRWVRGDKDAITKQQVRGFQLFVDENKGNCVACHSAPNFTDNGFHNIGLKSFGDDMPDMRRYQFKPLGIMKGAFKTPTLRDITLTAPYFHDGSAATLTAVIEHYVNGGEVKTHLSPNMKASLDLNEDEIGALVAFLKALEGQQKPFELPLLPL